MVAMSLLRLTPNNIIEFPSSLPNATSLLVLENISDRTVAFKVKTTAPKHYLVRPSIGVIHPNSSHEVKIVMQPHPQDTGVADRFLVQAVAVEEGVSVNKDFWTNVQKSVVQDQRLSVSVKLSDGSTAVPPQPASWASTPDDNNNSSSEAAAAATATAALNRPAAGGRQQQQDSVPLKVAPPANPSSSSIDVSSTQMKYNEMVQYCLALEKQKEVLVMELDALKQQVTTLETRLKNVPKIGGYNNNNNVPAGAVLEKKGFELWQVVAMIIGVVALMKICGWL